MKEQFIRLKDRLNDLSRRNRAIRLLKLYNKWNFDLASLDQLKESNYEGEQAPPSRQQVNDAERVLEHIRKGKQSVQLLRRSHQNETAAMMSHRLNTLARNLRAIEDETGMYDLYVGYPFLSGVLADGTFFRAPLLLYPVRLTMQQTSPQQWLLEKQEDGEPLLNRPLFLALKKFHHLHVDEAIYDEVSDHAEDDLTALYTWLKQHHIEVQLPESAALQPFTSYTQAELPDLPKGLIQMEPLAVLGHFPQGDSAIGQE